MAVQIPLYPCTFCHAYGPHKNGGGASSVASDIVVIGAAR